MITRYELVPVRSSRKSYYGKATVESAPQSQVYDLWSYNTRVATVNATRGKIQVAASSETGSNSDRLHSRTTVGHILDFLYQLGVTFDSMNWDGKWHDITLDMTSERYHGEVN